jgi:hypothetical protein
MKFEKKENEQQCIRYKAYSICSNGNLDNPVYVCYHRKEMIGAGITSQYEAKKICYEHSKTAVS